MKFESTRQKGTVGVLAVAVLLVAFIPFVADVTDADGSDPDYDGNSFYRYTIKFFSTSQEAEYLIWDFADGTVLDGRWEYYAQLQNDGEELTPEQTAGLAAYRDLLVANGNSIYAPIHTYATAGNYDYTITAINPMGYVGQGGMPYDGAFSTDEEGFDGGLSAGITLATYDDDDRTVSGAWDTATIALGVRGYPILTFVSNGGSAVAPITVENTDVYTVATAPTAPTKADNEFAGWYIDEELTQAFDWTQPVTASATLYAKWNAIEPEQITVYIDGHASTFEPGTTIGDLPAPTYEGYTFEGWYADAEKTQKLADSTVMTDGMNIYTNWTQNTVDPEQITFTVNGIPYQVDADPVMTIGDLTPYANTLLPEGYVICGWYSDSAYTTSIPASTVVTDGMAIFVKIAPAITVTVDGENVVVGEGSTVADLTVPTKEGYTFDGWYADAECTEALASDTVLTEGMNAYAKWNASGTVSGDSENNTIDWIPIAVMIAGAIVCLVGLRFHPVILVAGLVIAVVGGLDFGGIVNLF